MGLGRHSDVATPKRSCGPHRSLVPRQRLQKVRHLRNCVDTDAAMAPVPATQASVSDQFFPHQSRRLLIQLQQHLLLAGNLHRRRQTIAVHQPITAQCRHLGAR